MNFQKDTEMGVIVATDNGFFEASATFTDMAIVYKISEMTMDQFLDRINQLDPIPQDYNPKAIKD